jgi:hypothetical protein
MDTTTTTTALETWGLIWTLLTVAILAAPAIFATLYTLATMVGRMFTPDPRTLVRPTPDPRPDATRARDIATGHPYGYGEPSPLLAFLSGTVAADIVSRHKANRTPAVAPDTGPARVAIATRPTPTDVDALSAAVAKFDKAPTATPDGGSDLPPVPRPAG